MDQSARLTHEVELKYALKDKEALDRVLRAADPSDAVFHMILDQENFFFDTESWALRAQKIALRLRRENDTFTLTAKANGEKNRDTTKALSVHIECDLPVPQSAAEKMLSGELSALTYFASTPFNYDRESEHTRQHLLDLIKKTVGQQPIAAIGSFQNTRTALPIVVGDSELTLELDETIFNDSIQQYEVELEVGEDQDLQQAHDYLENLFAAAHIEAIPSRGKAERFYEYLKAGG